MRSVNVLSESSARQKALHEFEADKKKIVDNVFCFSKKVQTNVKELHTSRRQSKPSENNERYQPEQYQWRCSK